MPAWWEKAKKYATPANAAKLALAPVTGGASLIPGAVTFVDKAGGTLGIPGMGHYSAGEEKKNALSALGKGVQASAGRSASRVNASATTQQGYYGDADKVRGGYTPTSQLQDLYKGGTNTQKRFSGPRSAGSQVRNYYGGMSLGPGMGKQIYGERKTQGYGPNLVKESLSANPYSKDSRLGTFAAGMSQNRTNTEDRLHGGGRNPLDALDARGTSRAIEGNRPTAFQNWSTAQNPADFTRGSDAYGRDLKNSVADKNVGSYFDSLKTGDSSALSRELEGPFQSEASKRQQSLASGGGDSGKFLAGLDSSGLGRSAKRLADEGDTYEEEFYKSQRDGTNSQYQMLQNDLSERMQREAAARGQFVSGNALELAMKGSARLGAEEFANRGQLAATAGEARRARLGQQLEGANALEGLRQSTSIARDEMGNALSTSADGANNDRIRARGDIIGARESLMGDLSKDRDASERSKLDALGVNSRFGDSQLLDFAGKQLKAASGEEEARNVRTAASDAFSRSLSDRDQNRRDRDDDLASSADQERRSDNVFRRDTLGQADEADRAKYTDHLQSLGVAQDYDYRSAKGLDDLGMDASRDEIARDQFRFAAARGASDEQNAEQDGLDKLGAAADSANLAGAQAASDENRANFNTTFSAAMRSGDTRAMIESIRSAAENSVLTNADMTEINIALQRAGVDAETRASIGADIRQSVKDGAAIYAGLPPAAAVEAAPSAIPKAKPNPF